MVTPEPLWCSLSLHSKLRKVTCIGGTNSNKLAENGAPSTALLQQHHFHSAPSTELLPQCHFDSAPATRDTNVFVSHSHVRISILQALSVMVPYTFSVKPKRWTAVLWIVAARSSAVSYLHKLIPLGHSTVNAPSAWEVWWQFSNRGVGSQATVLNSSSSDNTVLLSI